MAASYVAMATALREHMQNVAGGVQAALGGPELQVVGLPDRTIQQRAAWLEVPAPSRKAGDDWTQDKNDVQVSVCVSVPYDVQAANPDAAWVICDLLDAEFPDMMPGHAVLGTTRSRGVQPTREQWGEASGPTQLVVRAFLTVPIYRRHDFSA